MSLLTQSFLSPQFPFELDINIWVRIDNPLKKYTPEQLDEVATSFATHFSFDGLDELFRKAARCARDPGIAHKVSGLTKAEVKSLEREGKIPFWEQSKQLKIAILTCCLGAAIQ